MTKRRFNIWLDKTLIKRVKTLAKQAGIKASTYMRMAILEKVNQGHPSGQPQNTQDVR